jgi:glutaconate CoA-transferase subunit B
MAEYSASEMMVVVAARQLADGRVVFVGIGLPCLAAILAKRTHAPRAVLLCESGIIDGDPGRLPLSVADPALVDGAASIAAMQDYFNLYLFGGKVDVGFIGGAQVDRWGNVNSTVIGAYARPKVRLPGSGGPPRSRRRRGRRGSSYRRTGAASCRRWISSPALGGAAGPHE